MALGLSFRRAWVEPRARRHDGHPRHDARIDQGTRKTCAAGVEHTHNIAVANAAVRRIGGVDPNGLTPCDLACARHRARIHLGVQAGCRLVGEEMDRPTVRGRAAEPLRGRKPGWVRRTLRVIQGDKRLRGDLDAA